MSGAFVPSVREYFRYFGLDREKLAFAKPDALVMHPGPMNRGVEIASDVADGGAIARARASRDGSGRAHGRSRGARKASARWVRKARSPRGRGPCF